jgi:hypothetical protein
VVVAVEEGLVLQVKVLYLAVLAVAVTTQETGLLELLIKVVQVVTVEKHLQTAVVAAVLEQ